MQAHVLYSCCFADPSPGFFDVDKMMAWHFGAGQQVRISFLISVGNLAESLQVAFDSGAKRILLPMVSVSDIPTIPGELFAKFQTSFYADPTDAVFKALGVY